MPTDYRRFNGPESAVSYFRYTQGFKKSYDEILNQLTDEKGLRKDGRAIEESRASYAIPDVVSQAKGSAYIEMKKTKVVCSVFDPREIPRQNEFSEIGQLFCEVKFAPFSYPHHRRPLAPEPDEKALSVALKAALEPAVCRHLFPNYQIDIYVYILENDGACLAASINAAGIALMNAAVPMYDIITACSAAVINDRIFIDPSEIEERVAINCSEGTNHGVATMSMLHGLKQVSDFNQIGSMDLECLMKIMDVLEIQCDKFVPYVQQVIVKDVLKSFKQKVDLDEEEKKREELLKCKVNEWKKLITESG